MVIDFFTRAPQRKTISAYGISPLFACFAQQITEGGSTVILPVNPQQELRGQRMLILQRGFVFIVVVILRALRVSSSVLTLERSLHIIDLAARVVDEDWEGTRVTGHRPADLGRGRIRSSRSWYRPCVLSDAKLPGYPLYLGLKDHKSSSTPTYVSAWNVT